MEIVQGKGHAVQWTFQNQVLPVECPADSAVALIAWLLDFLDGFEFA
jgi:hypothetical protein